MRIMNNGSIRCYYRLAMQPNASAKAGEAKTRGITNSILAHEPPQFKVSPDGEYAVLRVHWPADGSGRATYEAKDYVTSITDLEAADIVTSWSAVEG